MKVNLKLAEKISNYQNPNGCRGGAATKDVTGDKNKSKEEKAVRLAL